MPVNIAKITGGKLKKKPKSKWPQVVRMKQSVIAFVYLFSAWPLLFTAVSLTVWGWQFFLSIFGFSGCCCLGMNHESSSRSLQEMLDASCYGYSASWLTPCAIHRVRLISFVRLSLFHWRCASWPVASSSLQVFGTLWISLVWTQGCVVTSDGSSAKNITLSTSLKMMWRWVKREHTGMYFHTHI